MGNQLAAPDRPKVIQLPGTLQAHDRSTFPGSRPRLVSGSLLYSASLPVRALKTECREEQEEGNVSLARGLVKRKTWSPNSAEYV